MSNAHPIDLAKTPSFRLDGRRALVTGGGRGIGLAAASALAHAGAQVTLAARTKTEVEQAASAICARGGAAEALVLDVTDVEAARRAVAAEATPFQILVNNAGTNRPAYLADVKVEDFDAIFALNVRAACPSIFLRPHAQHGVLFRKRGIGVVRPIDYSDQIRGVVRIKLSDALSWLGKQKP